MRTHTPTHHNFPLSSFQAKNMQAAECGRGHGSEPQPTEHHPAREHMNSFLWSPAFLAVHLRDSRVGSISHPFSFMS